MVASLTFTDFPTLVTHPGRWWAFLRKGCLHASRATPAGRAIPPPGFEMSSLVLKGDITNDTDLLVSEANS